jgi:hypothetical protein
VKRALIALLIVAGIPFASIACSDDAAEQKTLKPTQTEDDNEPEPRSTGTSTSPVSTPSATPTSTFDAGPAPIGTQNCAASANALECAQCCVMKNNPLVGCGCNVGSQCQAACGQNFCAGGLPDIACGLCLFQAKCQIDLGGFGFGGGNDDNGGNSSATQGAIQACLQQSSCQSKGGGNLPGGFGGFGQP